ncbi:MAG: GT4 family glycosyltransferase PelF, partial [Oscillospiraceae bacterium]|nr:GT4 family glycosyltransferase PelF [Oscillospiraceae bacterium]
MRVCMILEGSYPYVHGGVSSWTHQYIQAMPDVEFVLWCIGAHAADRGKFKYALPDNVREVRELFLDDALNLRLPPGQRRRLNLTTAQTEALRRLFTGEHPDWGELFSLMQQQQINPLALLMSAEFVQILLDICSERFPYISFVDYFYTVRSMLLPELYLLTQPVPEADLYHATATGYSGLLGALAKWKNRKPYILTEHGIYTREREEELLRADWVLPYFRQQWIQLFYTFSLCAYTYADRVTALFSRANAIQADLGCAPDKLRVIPNGIHFDRFSQIPDKPPDGHIDIGAVVRIAKIKDIKTMIYAFAEVKNEIPSARLFIMGDVDDREYDAECRELIRQLQVKDISFTGVINVLEYLPRLDFTILTSISEGQPLSVLESFAAGRAVVATDVGCCRELIEEQDGLGPAGLIVPPMHKDLLAQAEIQLARSERLRRQMGATGRQRAGRSFTHTQ